MTDLSLVRGDSRNYRITITESDLVTPVDITNGIIRFAVKRFPGQSNADALIFKTSYDNAEVLLSDPVNGECLVQVFPGDAHDAAVGEYCWDLDLTRRGALLTNAGDISVVAGSQIITGASLDLAKVLPGDVLAPAGAVAANQKDLVITAVGGDGSALDPGAGNLRTDYSDWVTENNFSLEIYRGNRKTPVGLSGLFTILKDSAS